MRWYRCPGKVNLMLRVGPARDDGYHDVVTILAALRLYDRLGVEPRARGFALDIEDPGPGRDSIASGDENLVLRAAHHFAARANLQADEGARFVLEKRMPARAGLGGGSADAAGALRALRDLFRPTVDDATLAGWAGEVGSDVPFALRGGYAVGTRRGETLTPLEGPVEIPAVLACPVKGIGTADAYAALDRHRADQDVDVAPGEHALVDELRIVLAGMARGSKEVRDLGGLLWNDFDLVASHLVPRCGGIAEAFLKAGAREALLCGSGSAVLALCADADEQEAVVEGVTLEAGEWGPLATSLGGRGVTPEDGP